MSVHIGCMSRIIAKTTEFPVHLTIDSEAADVEHLTFSVNALPKVSPAYESADDFPGKDAPRIALAVLLEAGWTDADEAIKSLRSVISAYERSIAANAEEDTKRLAMRRGDLADFYVGKGYDDCPPTIRSLINRIIKEQDKN